MSFYNDFIFNFAQSLVSKEVITEEKSLFTLEKENKEIFINLKQKENVYNIDFSAKDVVFLDKQKSYNNRLYKDELKKKLSTYIYQIQYSKDFMDLLKKVDIRNPVEFINLINSCIEDKFDTNLIKDNIAYFTTKDSSVFIDFVNPNNYYSIFKIYSRENVQNLYISNVVKMMLEVFKTDVRITNFAKYLEEQFSKQNNRDWLVYLVIFVILTVVLLSVYFLHNYILDGNLLNKVKNNFEPKINKNNYTYF